jgi:plasmid maintenance system antidote protein VapI
VAPPRIGLFGAHYFGGDAQFWLNLKAIYELRTAERSPETRRAVREIEPRAAAVEAA